MENGRGLGWIKSVWFTLVFMVKHLALGRFLWVKDEISVIHEVFLGHCFKPYFGHSGRLCLMILPKNDIIVLGAMQQVNHRIVYDPRSSELLLLQKIACHPIYIHTYIYMCVCAHARACVRDLVSE